MTQSDATIGQASGASRRFPRRGATRTIELRDRITEDIVRGRLGPGVSLEESEIARRFCVSRTTVREAIRALAATGLVEARAHRSAIVARPTIERLRAMFATLAELEALCAGLAAEQMTVKERRQLHDLHVALGEPVMDGDPRRYDPMNEKFHGLIYTGSHNDYLAELTLATRARLSPFSHMQISALGRLSLSHAERDRVIAAIMRGDRAAAAAMRQHVPTVEISDERHVDST